MINCLLIKPFLVVIINLSIWTRVESIDNYCQIDYPNPEYVDSTRFEVISNYGKLDDIKNYQTRTTYRIDVRIADSLKWSNWRIQSAYMKLNSVENGDFIQNTGELFFNKSRSIVDVKNCKISLELKFQMNLPEYFQFYWTTPTDSVDNKQKCIKMTIVLILKRNVNIKYSNGRTFLLCEPGKSKMDMDPMSSDLSGFNNIGCEFKSKPDSGKSCRIGSTGIYRMIIRNKWNHLNHWKDWPGRDGFTPKLTEYIGASHSSNFNLYYYGGKTSDAVKSVCANGTNNDLQNMFKKSRNDLMTIILARALDVSSINDERSVLLAVNQSHNLVSFISHLHPSPDWCTGLSRIDLCDGRCTWPKQLTFNIYPWDAGVVAGDSYLSRSPPITSNNGKSSLTCPITSNWPKDNPFTRNGDTIQSLGEVTFKLIFEWNKERNVNCVKQSEQPVPSDQAYHSKSPKALPQIQTIRHCQFTQWSAWSVCSRSCGKGQTVRQRQLLKSRHRKCQLVSTKEVKSCSKMTECPPAKVSVAFTTCRLRLWGQWSPCNATCVRSGKRYRDRVYLNKQEELACTNYPNMRQVQTCHQVPARCQAAWVCRDENNHGKSCIWSGPSTRYYFDYNSKECKTFYYHGCYGNLNLFHTKEECSKFCTIYSPETVLKQIYGTNKADEWGRSSKVDRSAKSSSSSVLSDQEISKSVNQCIIPLDWGVVCDDEGDGELTKAQNRWYYDRIHQKCYRFRYAGCYGNANNFKTQAECEKTCVQRHLFSVDNADADKTDMSRSRLQQPCNYTEWSSWNGDCHSNCYGIETRVRYLVTLESNNECNVKEIQKQPCDLESCKRQQKYSKNSYKNSVRETPLVLQACKYSQWSPWSSCSVKCGRGVRQRMRTKFTSSISDCIPQFPQFNDREYCYNDCWSN